jgi:signal transduction histidine kinase
LAVLIAGLIWLGSARTRQIAVANAALRKEITVRRQTEMELEQAREKLEIRVAERTAELTRANESLNREIMERKLAEESRQRLEEQLYQSQKMDAIGRLAGGIAHDFNNVLAVIIPYCHLVHDELADRPHLQKQLREVLKASDLAKALVQQILAFSRKQRQERRVLDLRPVVKESLKLLRSALPSSIQMVSQINFTPPVLADPTQIHQVIMNLCVNAQHAMEGKQGRLEVAMDEVLVDETLVGLSADLQPGRYVRISVRDTGCGMAPETLNRIFEPFFTTKEVNQGTGLGLAVVHGIIKNHDGAIIVKSKPGEGSEFQIFLPARAAETEVVAKEEKPLVQAGGEHVLVVDDEVAVMNVLKLLLGRAGYKVTAFTDPREAFNHFRSHPDDFHLVVTDLTMPGMNGLELARKIFEVRPELPLVITTGFGGELVSETQMADHPNIRKVLEKPLSPDMLARLAAEVRRGKPI